jgi:hypothetical protein
MEQYPAHWPQFYTATILEWKHLLKPDKYKDIIIQSLQYLTSHKQRVTIFENCRKHLYNNYPEELRNDKPVNNYHLRSIITGLYI